MAKRRSESKVMLVGAWSALIFLVVGGVWFMVSGAYVRYSSVPMAGALPGDELHAAIESSAPLSEIQQIVQTNFLAVHVPYLGFDSALHWAAAEDRVDLVPIFLEVTFSDSDEVTSRIYAFQGQRGDAPIHCAIRNGHIDIVELLLKHGANPVRRRGDEMTPIELAESLNMPEMVELLEEHR